jgi:hypothetical protein
MAIINKTREASVDEDIEKWNPRAFLEGMWNGAATVGKSLEVPQKR